MDEAQARRDAIHRMSPAAREMVERWRREVGYLIGRDPHLSAPYKKYPLPAVKFKTAHV